MRKNTKGFTLIELVTVIAILGILGAMTIPKFFALQTKARQEADRNVIGNIKAGLETYSANEIVTNGTKTYPYPGTGSLFTAVLGETPTKWTYTAGSAATGIAAAGTITSGRTDSTITWKYYLNSTTDYDIVRQ